MIRIVKVGGSLLSLPDVGRRLHAWLAAQSPAHNVLIAGGGSFVEELRKIHAIRPINEVAAHWMAIDLLTVTAHLLHERLDDVPLVEDDRLLCQRVGEPGTTIFGPSPWLRHNEPGLPGVWLARDWHTTSDAIAARLAIVLRADELVLLKSSLPRRGSSLDLAALSRFGYVDEMIAKLSVDLPPTRFVNLRDEPPPEQWANLSGSHSAR